MATPHPDPDTPGSTTSTTTTTTTTTTTPFPSASSSSATVKTRRSHRKSRNGCAECKRRHIRCDERRPACSNCSIAERACAFPTPHQPEEHNLHQHQHQHQNHHQSQQHHQQHLKVDQQADQRQRQKRRQHQKQTLQLPHSPADSMASSSGGSTTTTLSPRFHDQIASVSVSISTPSPSSSSWEQHQQQQQHHQNHPQYQPPQDPAPGPIPTPARPGLNPGPDHTTTTTTIRQPLPCFTDRPPLRSGPPPPTLPSFTESFTGAVYFPPAPPPAIFTAQHLVLLHHASTKMGDCIMARGQTPFIVSIAIRRVVDAPYLIDQLLAFSALHLAATIEDASTPSSEPSSLLSSSSAASVSASSSSPSPSPLASPPSLSSPASLRHQATELQTRAVSAFTRATALLPADDRATCVPRFLFASILSLHVLAETLAVQKQLPPPQHHDSAAHFHGFIKRLVECLHLHRGVLAVIRTTWTFLMQSELEPLLSITSNVSRAAKTAPSPCAECLPLERIIDAGSLDPASAEACRGAIQRLQWAFDMHNSLPDPDGPHAVSCFAVTVEVEYVEVLLTLRPEALLILAYYGVLLHRCRRFWIFGDAGECLIRAVAGHLGSSWHHALAWPLQVIEAEHD